MFAKIKHSPLQRTRAQKIITNVVIALLFVISAMAIATILITPKMELLSGYSTADPNTWHYKMYSALWTSSYGFGVVFENTTFSGLGIAALTIAIIGLVIGGGAAVFTSLRLRAVNSVDKRHAAKQVYIWELVFIGLCMVIMLVFLIIALMAEPKADSEETFFNAIITKFVDFPGVGDVPTKFAETATPLGSALEFGGFGLLIISGGIGAIAVRTNSFHG